MKLFITPPEATFTLFRSSLLFSLCAGLIDIGLSMIIGNAPERLESFSVLSASLAAGMTCSLIVYLILRIGFNQIKTSKQFESESFSIFLFAGLLLSLSFCHLVRRVELPPQWLIRSIFFVVAFVIAAGICLFVSSRKKWIVLFILTLPFLIAAALVQIHVKLYGAGGIPLPVVWSACLLAIAVLFFLPDRWRIVVLLAVWFSIPAAAVGLPKWKRWQTAQSLVPNRVNHSIRHVVLITVDTLRRDALSYYDPHGNSTPNLDRLASDSIVFTRAFSPASWTGPALVSILTGYSPLVHKWYSTESGFPTIQMLAERMRKAGYFTGAITNTATTRLMASLRIRSGFLETDLYPKARPDRSNGTNIVDRIFPGYYRTEISTAQLTGVAVKWVTSNKDRDFFLWIHYFDPHLPYNPPASYVPRPVAPIPGNTTRNDLGGPWRAGMRVFTLEEKDSLRMLYEGEVRYVDDYIGRLLQDFRRQGIYDDTLLVLASAHGEELWEKGGFGHGHSLYNELIRVPLIIKLPNSQMKQKIDDLVSTESILPTILDLCDVPLPQESGFSSSLAPLWKSRSHKATQPLVSVSSLFRDPLMSLIFEKYKFIRNMDSGEEELYNLEDDPHETHNLKDNREKLEQARQILEEKKQQAELLRQRLGIRNESTVMDDETREMLRALGYLH